MIITDLLLEVNAWCRFTGALLDLRDGKGVERHDHLLTALLEGRLNLRLTKVAEAPPDLRVTAQIPTPPDSPRRAAGACVAS